MENKHPKIGDRVICNIRTDNMYGEKGTIIEIVCEMIRIKWDNESPINADSFFWFPWSLKLISKE